MENENNKNAGAAQGALSWPDVCKVIADCLEAMGRAVEACDEAARFTILFGASWSMGDATGKEERIRTMSTALGSTEMGRLVVSDMRMRYSSLFAAPEGERKDVHVALTGVPGEKYS